MGDASREMHCLEARDADHVSEWLSWFSKSAWCHMQENSARASHKQPYPWLSSDYQRDGRDHMLEQCWTNWILLNTVLKIDNVTTWLLLSISRTLQKNVRDNINMRGWGVISSKCKFLSVLWSHSRSNNFYCSSLCNTNYSTTLESKKLRNNSWPPSLSSTVNSIICKFSVCQLRYPFCPPRLRILSSLKNTVVFERFVCHRSVSVSVPRSAGTIKTWSLAN